jgi:Lrp/AsnC family transcriptional regulator of ectoine degradation
MQPAANKREDCVRDNLDAAATAALLSYPRSTGARVRVGAAKTGTQRLDARDIKILSILQREGRISKTALAERVNLSSTPCWERLKRLEQAGIIESYGAQISLRAFGPLTIVFVEISIENHRRDDFVHFEKAIAAVPEIVECWAVGGGIDYLCKVVVRNIGEYQALIERLLEAQIGIQRYFTYVVTAAIKNEPIPVQLLARPSA